MRFIRKEGVYARDAISLNRRADCVQLDPEDRAHLEIPVVNFSIRMRSNVALVPESNIQYRIGPLS